jgi:hypothetical protein
MTALQYLFSRLKIALTSPAKLRLFIYILIRYPIIWSYFRARAIRRKESARLKEARLKYASITERDLNPLVSVVIATYNRGQILCDRPLKSILAQTYQNFEVIVVGDGCTDNTGELVAGLNNPRIRYINLQERGKYPADPKLRWYVAGVPPINYAAGLISGDWVAHVDDDEIFTPDHLEKLLRFAQHGDYEFVYSIARHETHPGQWIEVGKTPLARLFYMNNCGHSSTMWRNYITLFDYDMNTWRLRMPADMNRWSRLQLAGVRIGFLPALTAIAPLRPGTTMYGHQAEDRV